jgi:hypothetical protein
MDAMCLRSKNKISVKAAKRGMDWGKCQPPAEEIERQVRERREEEQRVREQKKQYELARKIVREKNMELRPQCPPSRNPHHRAEVPCDHCKSPLERQKQRHPPTDCESSPICPAIEAIYPPAVAARATAMNVRSLKLRGGVFLADCSCKKYNGLQARCNQTLCQ